MPQERAVAALVEAGFEDLELFYPMHRLREAGYEVDVLTPDGEPREGEHGYAADDVKPIDEASVQNYAGLLLPGGVGNPDKLRMRENAVDFVRRFVRETDRPVFAICHGAWTLIEADVLEGVKMTSYASIRTDCENAGANWTDEPVVRDGRWVTSRNPDDLPHFGRTIVEALGGEAETREEKARA